MRTDPHRTQLGVLKSKTIDAIDWFAKTNELEPIDQLTYPTLFFRTEGETIPVHIDLIVEEYQEHLHITSNSTRLTHEHQSIKRHVIVDRSNEARSHTRPPTVGAELRVELSRLHVSDHSFPKDVGLLNGSSSRSPA